MRENFTSNDLKGDQQIEKSCMKSRQQKSYSDFLKCLVIEHEMLKSEIIIYLLNFFVASADTISNLFSRKADNGFPKAVLSLFPCSLIICPKPLAKTNSSIDMSA